MNKCDFEYDQESFSEVFKRQADSADAALENCGLLSIAGLNSLIKSYRGS